MNSVTLWLIAWPTASLHRFSIVYRLTMPAAAPFFRLSVTKNGDTFIEQVIPLMIQRIQTVYLFLGAAFMAAFFAFPTVWSGWIASVSNLLPWVLLLWGSTTALLGFVSIFLYTNRTRQRRMVIITQWMTIVFAAALYSLLTAIDRFAALFGGQISVAYTIAVLLPVAAYIMFHMGRRGIEHDIEKIRSVDRLR